VASLVYYELPDGSIDFAETWTPLEIRERGITTAIIKYALEWARREGHRIIPGCPFVATYVDRHNDCSDLLVTRSSKR
jgi:predicted GNAT family acetyltransferase